MNYNQLAGQKIQRTETLSDGVFAIAMTLLVLDIKIPSTEPIHSEADCMQLQLHFAQHCSNNTDSA